MKLSQVLKEAITNLDWELVAKLYTNITGEFIEIPKPSHVIADPEILDIDDVHPIDVSQIIQVAPIEKKSEHGPSPEKRYNFVSSFTVSSKKESSEKGKQCKTVPFVKKAPGEFKPIDTGDNLDDTKSQNPMLVKLYGTPKQRQKNKNKSDNLVEVKCSICKKVEKVNPILASTYDPDEDYNSYRCNSCCVDKRR